MFNSIKIYCNSWLNDEFDLVKDFIVEIDGSYYSIQYGVALDHPDISKFDVLLSTSSLDKLEIFILKLFMKDNRTFSEDCLLHYLVGFFSSYSSKLVNAIEEELGLNHVFD